MYGESDETMPPDCHSLRGALARTHGEPDAEGRCPNCRRKLVRPKCFECQKRFLKNRNDYDNIYCPECCEEIGI